MLAWLWLEFEPLFSKFNVIARLGKVLDSEVPWLSELKEARYAGTMWLTAMM
jgi:hypothetical protein